MPKKSKQQIINFIKEDRIKLATVSGVLTTKPNLIKWVDENIPEIELITTKSYQVKPNPGNREPIVAEMSVGNFANAVGLRNPGMEKGYQELAELKNKHQLSSLLNISLSGNSIEDFIILVKKFEDVADILELNFSCPHAATGYGASIGCDVGLVANYIKEIRKETTALIFPKLTPNVGHIGEIAKAAIAAGADGIVAINTVGPEVHIEPHSGKPILYNPKGHQGGKSGNWIKEIAINKIKEIREAVGPDVPIIGMGGVSTGEDIKKIKKAGADVIGLGSVFARVKQPSMPDFVSALKTDATTLTPPAPPIRGETEAVGVPPLIGGDRGGSSASKFLIKERLAEYKPFKINKIIQKNDDLKIFELDGEMDFKSSQFAFIWIPDVGEKPFAIVKNNPLTFIVRKREYDFEQKKGLFTHGMFALKEGDEIFIRGVYGKDAPESDKKNAYIVAGGTGIAVVPKLAEKLNQQGKKVTVYSGVKSADEIVFKEEIKKYAKYIPVIDDGVVARVLKVMEEDIALSLESSLRDSSGAVDACFYNAGPRPLMKRAMEIQQKLGADKKDIFSSIETNNMCGMGVCGECECGGILTCQEGTFFSLEFLEEKEIDIMKI
jgi:dihydroorotate dehydrogenase (NAD+) catalytic subunit